MPRPRGGAAPATGVADVPLCILGSLQAETGTRPSTQRKKSSSEGWIAFAVADSAAS